MADPREVFDTGLRPADVDPQRPLLIDTPWGPFAIFDCDGTLRAAQAFCPHLMGPLFQGTLAGDTVTCPWHQWRFSLASGRRLDARGCELAHGEELDTLDVHVGPLGTILVARERRPDADRRADIDAP